MKVISKQRNSRMCAICGLDNPFGVQAPFYNMEDGSVITLFQFRQHHQSYPGRAHGGIITAMLDELGLRSLWAKHLSEEQFGVTISLNSNFRKPVPLETPLMARGVITRESHKFFITDACVMDMSGTVLANGTLNYIKLDTSAIAAESAVHEEMAYLRQDDVTEIDFKK